MFNDSTPTKFVFVVGFLTGLILGLSVAVIYLAYYSLQ